MNEPTSLLFEVSSEVCYKAGGIHRVITSKITYQQKQWGHRYYLIGAYLPEDGFENTFHETPDDVIIDGSVRDAVKRLREKGIGIHVGYWQTEGRPLVLLLELNAGQADVRDYISAYVTRHRLEWFERNRLLGLYGAFGFYLESFFKELALVRAPGESDILVHFHEYLTTMALPGIRAPAVKVIFTVHATVIGRYLAYRNKTLHLPPGRGGWEKSGRGGWEKELKRMSPYSRSCSGMERVAAVGCDVLTTVSPLTGKECLEFLGRSPDLITPNGLNINYGDVRTSDDTKSAAKIIHSTVARHFGYGLVPKNKTVIFFTSGRYEYRNKGFQPIIRALALLKDWLRQHMPDLTVVMIFITDEPYSEGNRFMSRMRRWKRGSKSPGFFLYPAPDKYWDCLLVKDLIKYGLRNENADPVKVLYHPRFLTVNGPVLKMDYLEFIKGCDLGVFPSYYEPWGYTMAECLCSGVPVVLSDLAGVAGWLAEKNIRKEEFGVFTAHWGNGDMADSLFRIFSRFLQEKREYRDTLQHMPGIFDWDLLMSPYRLAYQKAAGHEHLFI